MKLITATLLIIYGLSIYNLDPKVDYLAYHKQVNQALELTSKAHFVKAQEKLELIMKQYDFVFAKDYMIAAQLAAHNQDEVKAIQFLEKAVEGGCLLSCVPKLSVFDDLCKSAAWDSLKLKEKALRKNYIKSIETDLLTEICERYQFEQDRKGTKLYKTVVYDNFKRIKEITEEHGFPGERLLGLDYSRLAQKLDDCDFGNSKVVVTLLHYDSPIAELGEAFFLEAIRAGNLHPREFANIYNYEVSKVSVLYGKSNKSLESLPEYHFNFPFGKKIEDYKRVNKDRAKFEIVALEVDERLAVLADKYGMKFEFGYK